ncbi:hypothetical protein BB559_001549 [Furculomyces boomerangus]|uniref:Rho-GAP domain-containing protein n=1 Tax=Furculomyces boomerangus TaxID=61424 RepID=A0A2T9Z1K7_9FUNG|nr:hypothetical protein BB559_001549 [Furculomyces boomerangus]
MSSKEHLSPVVELVNETYWIQIYDPQSQNTLYLNTDLGECTRKLPETAILKNNDPNEVWWELLDKNSLQIYYFNPFTNQTEWSRPENVIIIPAKIFLNSSKSTKRFSERVIGLAQYSISEEEKFSSRHSLNLNADSINSSASSVNRNSRNILSSENHKNYDLTKNSINYSIPNIYQYSNKNHKEQSPNQRDRLIMTPTDLQKPEPNVKRISTNRISMKKLVAETNILSPPQKGQKSTYKKSNLAKNYSIDIIDNNTELPDTHINHFSYPSLNNSSHTYNTDSNNPGIVDSTDDITLDPENRVNVTYITPNQNDNVDPQDIFSYHITKEDSANSKAPIINISLSSGVNPDIGLKAPSISDNSETDQESIIRFVEINEEASNQHTNFEPMDPLTEPSIINAAQSSAASKDSLTISSHPIEQNIITNIVDEKEESTNSEEYCEEDSNSFDIDWEDYLTQHLDKNNPQETPKNDELHEKSSNQTVMINTNTNSTLNESSNVHILDQSLENNNIQQLPMSNETKEPFIEENEGYLAYKDKPSAIQRFKQTNRETSESTSFEVTSEIPRSFSIETTSSARKNKAHSVLSENDADSLLFGNNGKDLESLADFLRSGQLNTYSHSQTSLYNPASRKSLIRYNTNTTPSENDSSSYSSFENYGKLYFSKPKKSFFKHQTTLKELLSYSNEPLSQPLHSLPKHIAKNALNCFHLITKTMNSKEFASKTLSSSGDSLVFMTTIKNIHKLLGMCSSAKNQLNNEVYSQVCKQLIRNYNTNSLKNGWTLLAILSISFVPDKTAQPYFESFIADQSFRFKENLDSGMYNGNNSGLHDSYKEIQKIVSYTYSRFKKTSSNFTFPVILSKDEIRLAAKISTRLPIFGVSLENIMKVPEYRDTKFQIPLVLRTLVETILECGGHKCEGLFRVPGDSDKILSAKLPTIT